MGRSQCIHSSVDGHLSCFHFFITVNNVAVNIWIASLCEHVLSFFLGGDLRVELLDYVATLCLTFLGTVTLFATAALPALY